MSKASGQARNEAIALEIIGLCAVRPVFSQDVAVVDLKTCCSKKRKAVPAVEKRRADFGPRNAASYGTYS
jgi:hypothetical protein